MFLNYPNNPTAACADVSFFRQAVELARECKFLIAHDAAYSEVFFDDLKRPPSILQVPGAKECCIELHSLSKTFNMTGWRVGFAVGNPDAIAALAKVKNNIDSGVFGAIQAAAVDALSAPPHHAKEIRTLYAARRDTLVHGLKAAGWSVDLPAATFYVWARCPNGWTSMAVAARLLDEASVVAIPGIGFGGGGEGYVRFALTVPQSRTEEAVARIAGIAW